MRAEGHRWPTGLEHDAHNREEQSGCPRHDTRPWVVGTEPCYPQSSLPFTQFLVHPVSCPKQGELALSPFPFDIYEIHGGSAVDARSE